MIDYRDATPADAQALDAMAVAVWIETFAHGVGEADAATYLGQAYGSEGKLIADLTSGTAQFRLAIETFDQKENATPAQAGAQLHALDREAQDTSPTTPHLGPGLRRGGAEEGRAVAERIVGYCKVNDPWLPDAEPGAMQLSQIYVTYDQHGSGVGRVLLDWAIESAKAARATALLLTVWEENRRAYAFYKKHGFEHVGDYAFPVGAQIDTDHIMRLAL